MSDERKPRRREQILQALALMLEEDSGKRITTAALARQVGVSEAALYRHFPSKARMFEGLIDFIEESIFARITRIMDEVPDATNRCGTILSLVLGFAEKNPGLARVMGGDVLTGETARLRHRIHQLFERLEAQFKQILREAELREGRRPSIPASAAANLLIAHAEGRISQYVRSDFKRLPTDYWDDQWILLSGQLLREAVQPA
ncbi:MULTISPECIES: nucleoid occlusion factor SlmA [Halomonadaceae]|jgi:TetR/AcrR family transcriptional regulator|uniref:Nucleoid occlusion factor SlmA n=1 Tax=Vreelandella janggokensis TaxID=370767 RepID=A0ABT4IRH1_9GAMM|nr:MULTISPECIES: nucleoid occlusion factor SlmA [Halomonas]MCW4150180.1 nucleoid occlusion factor SlmA [Halomonas sp. 18H]MCZ0926265.1 nucleoid occlusion factor SlmA [Halomonas janggokensis]MCZ0931332.1 nucleoid occlusion factor SlmA [Halomonas janggokensis]MDR5887634.1 nucleoid occlusion factor SlmA [Halomonas janggokensis]QPL46686.1 nucleoid occlusion factor SlmA [Halomonas sp. A40-4]